MVFRAGGKREATQNGNSASHKAPQIPNPPLLLEHVKMTVVQSSSAADRAKAEAAINRNPHGNFDEVQASRSKWEGDEQWHVTQTVNTTWKLGDGANDTNCLQHHKAVEIDPHEEGRPVAYNYKLLISGFIPRPISLLSTVSKDGCSSNLAPFSYSQIVNDDPPVFAIGFASNLQNAKDSLRNLVETGECVINTVSEHFVEAANSTSINAPYGESEWKVSGLNPASCAIVKPPRVQEAIFSIEGKLLNIQEFDSRSRPGEKSGTLALIEGIRFWVREDALNEERNLIDPAILKPVSRLGGITYGRTTTGYEMLRPDWNNDMSNRNGHAQSNVDSTTDPNGVSENGLKTLKE